MDRQDWIPAGALEIGERLQAKDGSTPQLLARAWCSETEPVYNIEVEGDHCYRVGEQGLLVHNASVPTAPSQPGQSDNCCDASALFNTLKTATPLPIADSQKQVPCDANKDLVYLILDGHYGTNTVLKIGESTVENFPETRSKEYRKASSYLGSRRNVVFTYVCFKCKTKSKKDIEVEIRTQFLASFPLPWDNEPEWIDGEKIGRLGRVGPGIPAKNSSPLKRKGYKWWDELPTNIKPTIAAASVQGESYRQIALTELRQLLQQVGLQKVAEMFALEHEQSTVSGWLTNNTLPK